MWWIMVWRWQRSILFDFIRFVGCCKELSTSEWWIHILLFFIFCNRISHNCWFSKMGLLFCAYFLKKIGPNFGLFLETSILWNNEWNSNRTSVNVVDKLPGAKILIDNTDLCTPKPKIRTSRSPLRTKTFFALSFN